MRTTEMSIHRGVDTDAHIYNGISPSLEESEIMPFAATRMDLEIIILSEISQREIPYDIPSMQTLKRKDTGEFTYQTETDSQT